MSRAEEIGVLIEQYRELKNGLDKAKKDLEINNELKQEKRKNNSTTEENLLGAEILKLNEEWAVLKESISTYKKDIKALSQEIEYLLFDNVIENYEPIFDEYLSTIWDSECRIVIKRLGDIFEPKYCDAEKMIVSRDRSQHGKVIRTTDYGVIKNGDEVIKKAVVEVIVFNKKIKAGEEIQFDENMLGRKFYK